MKAKKSLGQNFLNSLETVKKMVEVSGANKKDIVLEIGPGKGVLTEEILETGAKVIAVEKDRELIAGLSEKFSKEIAKRQLVLINDDVFNINLEGSKDRPCYFSCSHYKIIANIPYYITGKILKYFLSNKIQPSLMCLLVQKEVAQRIVAKDKKESILSISVKAYGVPKYIQKVSARYFSPKPKVDSAVILIDNISKKFFKDFTEKEFFNIVKTGFSSKRKTLENNLKKIIDKKELENVFKKCSIPKKIRAESLNIENWKCLHNKI